MFEQIETPNEGERVVIVTPAGDPQVVTYEDGKYVVGYANRRPQHLSPTLVAKTFRWVP